MLLYRGYDANGKRVQEKFKFRPTMFLPSKEQDTKWKALDGTPVEPMQFGSMSELREFQKTYEGVSSMKLYGNDKHIPAFIQAQFPLEIQWHRNRINVANLDIETMWDDGYSQADEAANPIASIAVKSGVIDKHCHVWGTKSYDAEASPLSQKFTIVYHQYASERQMLQAFIDWWSHEDNCPDVVTGWNIREFDIPYLINRMAKVIGEDET